MFALEVLIPMNVEASEAERQGLPWPRANGISINKPRVKDLPAKDERRKSARKGKGR